MHACDRRRDKQTDRRTDIITTLKTALAYARAVNTVFTCPCRRCELNWRQDKTYIFYSVEIPRKQCKTESRSLQTGNKSYNVQSVEAIVTPPRGRGAEYCDQFACMCISLSVCLCVCLCPSVSLEPLDRSSRIFLCGSPVAVARSSSGGVAIRYVLPVLWMTSRLAVIGATPKVAATLPA